MHSCCRWLFHAAREVLAAMAFVIVTGNAQAQDTTWFDDALPTGASVSGDLESWNWVATNPSPRSGTPRTSRTWPGSTTRIRARPRS